MNNKLELVFWIICITLISIALGIIYHNTYIWLKEKNINKINLWKK